MSRPLRSPEYEAAKWVKSAVEAFLRERAPARSLTEAIENWLKITGASPAPARDPDDKRITAEAIAAACEECGIHENEAAEDVPGFIRRLRRERDEARGALVADSHNQRAQLAEYGLADEFVAHIGSDLASGLGEALVVARRERDKLGEQIDLLVVAAQDAVRNHRRAADAEAREAVLREALRSTPNLEHDCFEQECPTCSYSGTARAALALPADRSALDALLAAPRRAGAQACVEAAERFVAELEEASCNSSPTEATDTAHDMQTAVERAAAELGATKEPAP